MGLLGWYYIESYAKCVEAHLTHGIIRVNYNKYFLAMQGNLQGTAETQGIVEPGEVGCMSPA